MNLSVNVFDFIYICSPAYRNANSKFTKWLEPTEDEKERKELMEILPLAKTTQLLKEATDEMDKILNER